MNKLIAMPLIVIAISMLFGGCIVGLAMTALHHAMKPDEKQVRKWNAILSREHHVSGQPWKVEVDEPTYEAARKTVETRLNWQDKCFMVEPVTKNYVDIRHMQLTP